MRKENKTPEKPTFPKLPKVLDQIVNLFHDPEDKDLMLLGSLCCISSAMPKLYGVYMGRKVFPNLFLFVTAPPASGKGKLNYCRKLVTEVDKYLKNESENGLFLPANSSATGMYELLSSNMGIGQIFETEGDTMSNMFNQDYGNYSDGLRKAFHHEPIALYRRGGKEKIEIETPKLSVLLSGTHDQILSLISDVENGLASRFLYYTYEPEKKFQNPFSNDFSDKNIEEVFEELGNDVLTTFKLLNQEVEFKLTSNQEIIFFDRFNDLEEFFREEYGEGFIPFVRRAAFSAFRVCMILTGLRINETNRANTIYCSDFDFDMALKLICDTLWDSAQVYKLLLLVGKKQIFKSQNEENLFCALPKDFTRKEYNHIATESKINLKTAEKYLEKYIRNGLIVRVSQGNYTKEA